VTRVTVVVPTYQRPERLPRLIAALEAQTLPRDEFDVVISDDASADETPVVLKELAAKSPLRLRIVTNERNSGPAVARNLAWRTSDAPVIAFTDDDCAPAPGWLEAGLRRLEDARIAIVQGKTIPDPAAERRPWDVSQDIAEFSKRFETCNIFYRTDVLRDLGGFDETMPFFGEDTVLGWSALRHGLEAGFEQDALVHHGVIYPGVRYHLRWARMHRNWATLIRRFPEMRKEVLYYGLFIKKRHAGFLAAILGLALGWRWRPALLLALPYVVYRAPRSLGDLKDRTLRGTAFDAVVVAGLLEGSIREHTLVL